MVSGKHLRKRKSRFAPQFSRGLLKGWNHSRWLMLMRTESQGLGDWKEDTTHYNYIGTIVRHYKDPYPPMKEGSDFVERTHLPRPTKLNWMPTALWQRTCPSSFVSYSENCLIAVAVPVRFEPVLEARRYHHMNQKKHRLRSLSSLWRAPLESRARRVLFGCHSHRWIVYVEWHDACWSVRVWRVMLPKPLSDASFKGQVSWE